MPSSRHPPARSEMHESTLCFFGVVDSVDSGWALGGGGRLGLSSTLYNRINGLNEH